MANHLPKILIVCGLALIAAPAQQAAAKCVAPATVDGLWLGDDGGTYYVRVLKHDVFWVGMSGDNGRSWTHVFHGIPKGFEISGEWADVRGNKGAGAMSVRVIGTTQMVRKEALGSGFAATRWHRPGCR
ncbi:MAG TPA: hypothetical protein VE989_04795 [Sphingomicrobium sp.]|jgi:hypothetical protein|nr:hypothetical protein [Sphingomicrobium sp.]